MYIRIKLHCPRYHSGNIIRNGKKSTGQQNYLFKECRRQFIADHERTYLVDYQLDKSSSQYLHGEERWGQRHSDVLSDKHREGLFNAEKSEYRLRPKQNHYDCLEIDEFWTYVGKKSNKIWLIYAYHRATREIVAHVWRKQDTETAKRFRKQLRRLGIKYDRVAADNWESFVEAFKGDRHYIGKQYTKGIEENKQLPAASPCQESVQEDPLLFQGDAQPYKGL